MFNSFSSISLIGNNDTGCIGVVYLGSLETSVHFYSLSAVSLCNFIDIDYGKYCSKLLYIQLEVKCSIHNTNVMFSVQIKELWTASSNVSNRRVWIHATFQFTRIYH